MGGGEDGHSEVEEGAVLAGRRDGSSLDDGPLTFSEITLLLSFHLPLLIGSLDYR